MGSIEKTGGIHLIVGKNITTIVVYMVKQTKKKTGVGVLK